MADTHQCSVDGHTFTGRITKGMCQKHYMRLLRKGHTGSDRNYTPGGKPCATDPTHGKAHAHGLCTSCDAKRRRDEQAFGQCGHGACDNNAGGSADGYCTTHHWRSVNNKDMDAPIRGWSQQEGPCVIDGCTKDAASRGLCKGHAKRPGDARILENGRPTEHGMSGSYGPGWHAAKRTVQERDERKCRACGFTEEQNGKQLPVAHLMPAGSFEKHLWPLLAHHPANLILLCPTCHSKFDNAPETRWNYRDGGGRNVWPEWTAQPVGLKLELAMAMIEAYRGDMNADQWAMLNTAVEGGE